jgi:amino acid transporter
MSQAADTPKAASLHRGMGLLPAAAANIIGMVGIGPFLVVPLMIGSMGGPHILYAWVAGAILAFADGLVYAHLGAALPGSGGSYLYLREAYKPFKFAGLPAGDLLAFVFICQVILVAPLSIASGGVGFADYLRFYWTDMTPLQHDLVAGALCVFVTTLLWRNIEDIGKLAVVLLGFVVLTVGWVIVAGLFNFSFARAFDWPAAAYVYDADFFAKLGATAILAMYSYGGYNQVCNIAEEIKNPVKTMPRAIILSIVVVASIYITMSTVILGMIPWQEAKESPTIASLFIARTFDDPATGRIAALVMTVMIQFVAAASLYAVILGYSRIPFAAARDGQFFGVFAKLHPTKAFPHVSLLTVGLLAVPFCFFSLGKLATWLIQVQILLCFLWQCAGVILLRRHRKDLPQPFVMWLYPIPALLSGALWLYIFIAGPREGILFSFAYLVASIAAFVVFRFRATRLGPAPPMRG